MMSDDCEALKEQVNKLMDENSKLQMMVNEYKEKCGSLDESLIEDLADSTNSVDSTVLTDLSGSTGSDSNGSNGSKNSSNLPTDTKKYNNVILKHNEDRAPDTNYDPIQPYTEIISKGGKKRTNKKHKHSAASSKKKGGSKKRKHKKSRKGN